MDANASPLDRLADRAGIALVYHDLDGQPHHPDEAGKRSLLAAMGIRSDTDAEIAAALSTLEQADARPLPPVLVAAEGATISVPLALPTNWPRGPLAWRVETEDGEVLEGTVPAPDAGALVIAPAAPLPLGYHRLELDLGDAPAATTLIVAPTRAFGLADLGIDRRLWGVAAPLYGLRSARNWGIGDFADLDNLVQSAVEAGAALVGINPVHALFRAEPSRISPYSPSSRLYLNPLHLALDAVPVEFPDAPPANLAALRDAGLVDYPAVAAAKFARLEDLYRRFNTDPGDDEIAASFLAFRDAEAPSLHRFAVFEALSEQFDGPGQVRWQDWPAAYRDPDSQAVETFAEQRADRVGFAQFLQWLSDFQLKAVQHRALSSGMPVGLYGDLAVGVDPGGADVWADQEFYGHGVSLGAPPDQFSPAGQEWGLAPLLPRALREAAYAPFAAVLQRAMRHVGALRIDHALGLERCFWVPDHEAAAGSYVRYPLHDLLAVIRLESHRNRCLVIGEDLGNVPQGLRDSLGESGLLGYRVFAFERDHAGAFRACADYASDSLAAAATHDLPTCKGHWSGRDIDWRARIGHLGSDEEVARVRAERVETNRAILHRLAEEGLLPDGLDPESPPAEMPDAVLDAIHRFLARTPSAIAIVQYEDMLGEIEQPNLPGTVDEHPNWRRRPGPLVERLGGEAGWHRLAAIMRQERDTAARQTANRGD